MAENTYIHTHTYTKRKTHIHKLCTWWPSTAVVLVWAVVEYIWFRYTRIASYICREPYKLAHTCVQHWQRATNNPFWFYVKRVWKCSERRLLLLSSKKYLHRCERASRIFDVDDGLRVVNVDATANFGKALGRFERGGGRVFWRWSWRWVCVDVEGHQGWEYIFIHQKRVVLRWNEGACPMAYVVRTQSFVCVCLGKLCNCMCEFLRVWCEWANECADRRVVWWWVCGLIYGCVCALRGVEKRRYGERASGIHFEKQQKTNRR